MKKTLITLFAMATCAMGATDLQEWTYTTNGSGDAGGASACGLAFTLNTTGSRYTVDLPDVSKQPLTFNCQLDEITFHGVLTENKAGTPGGASGSTVDASTLNYYLYITDADKNVLGCTSSAVNLPKVQADYTFSDFVSYADNSAPLTLSSGTQYYAYFVHEGRVESAVSDAGVLTPAEANGLIRVANALSNVPNNSSNRGEWNMLNANANGVVSGTYCYNVTMKVLVPEPATATLSLLALAGLAARRRRR